MSLDIYSYFEVRRSATEPWRLWKTPSIDEDGRLDVPRQHQPFGWSRDRRFATALTGIITRDNQLDLSRLQPIVPEGREAATEMSPELAQIAESYGNEFPYWLTLADLARIDWDARVPTSDETDVTWEDAAPFGRPALEEMKCLADEYGADNVRLVFWFT